MSILDLIFTAFVGTIALTVCLRMGKLVVRIVNRFFDRLEDGLG